MHHRLADFAKIKVSFALRTVTARSVSLQAELSVDDFLSPDDPRIMAEGTALSRMAHSMRAEIAADITDRFDFSFVFGDLNFRLDITRLHADWLISRKGIVELELPARRQIHHHTRRL